MYYFIVNPTSRSGRGQEYWNRIKPILKEKEIEFQVQFSKEPGHTEKLVRELCSKCTEEQLYIVVLGGDGTMNEAVQGIDDFNKVILSYIPTGSSNDLARDLGISRNPEEALDSILSKKREVFMDMGVVHYEKAYCKGEKIELPPRRFMVGCGIGFDAAVCEEAMRSPAKAVLNRLGLGKLTYLSIALKQLMKSGTVGGGITLDGKEWIPLKRLFFAVGMVHRYEGGGFMFCPDAKADDGLLDFCIAHNATKMRVLRILPTAFKGEHIRFKEINMYRAKEALIYTDVPMWVQTDGEVQAQASRIHLTSAKEKVHMIY